MLPIKLTMSAFGPFTNVQHIDFSALGENPLFLINGPTGAGKTSILDAICFALYGKTTGDEREGSQMRCDMADEALLTYVEFSFKLGGKTYRIHRVPEQPRLKKSGDGYTQQKPEAQLYCHDGETENLLVAAKVSQATTEIELLTGLDVAQFRQVMVLPQGKFRELLMADSSAREKILSQLFQTHIYRRIEDQLKHQALAIKAEVRDHQSRRQGVLQSVALEEVQALTDELALLTPELAALLADKLIKQQAQAQSKQDFDSANGLMAEFTQQSGLKQTALTLANQAEAIKVQQGQFEKAQQAERIRPIFDEQQSRVKEHGSQQRQHEVLQQQLTLADKALVDANEQAQGLNDLEAEQSQITVTISELEALAPKFAEREQVNQDCISASKRLDELKLVGVQAKATLESSQSELAAIKQQLPQLEAQSSLQLELQQQKSALDAVMVTFQKWQQAQQVLQITQGQLAQAKPQGIAIKAEYDEAKMHHQTLQLNWHQGQAAILAKSLAQDMPCPVCGSAEHPSPASAEFHLPTEPELEQASLAVEAAHKAYSDAREAYKVLQQALQQQQALSQGFETELGVHAQYSQEQLNAEQQALGQSLVQANQAHQQLDLLRSKQTQLNEQLDGLQLQLTQERERYTQQQAHAEKLKGSLEQLDKTLPQDYLDLASLQQAIKQLAAKAKALTQSVSAIRTLVQVAVEQQAHASASLTTLAQGVAEALIQRQLSEQRLTAELSTAGFADQAAYSSACLDSQQCSALLAKINAYQQEVVTNTAKLEQLTTKLEDQTAPDIPQLETRLNTAQSMLQTAEQAWQKVHTRTEQLTQVQTQLEQMDKASAALELEYSVIGTLSDVANGNTGNRVSLQRFVLSVLLDDVLLEASRRLQMMSKGRYRLLRKEDRAKGNKASGLELEVEDAYTSKVRSVATLSGGESFMAALSMALGLSDVVQAYAGGIKLDTLFIDEGFGSLDQDSLELAIRTLMDLQSSGRMIGVISHVSEMKEQIGTRLDVIKGAHGSETRVILP